MILSRWHLCHIFSLSAQCNQVQRLSSISDRTKSYSPSCPTILDPPRRLSLVSSRHQPGSLEGQYVRLEVSSGNNLQVPSGRMPAGIYISINVHSRRHWKLAVRVLSSDSSVAWGDTVTLQSLLQGLDSSTHYQLADKQMRHLDYCHTAVGDEETPDEVILLAAGLQFSGFKSVIGTLWVVDDVVAKHVVEAFYENMFRKNGVVDCTRQPRHSTILQAP
ncbi:hypothetical protein DFH29DRAFT_499012 [Suillus ampliporus]|nr:hypothetical protein DFH29DRAFT_499012 [Suillus ampliporus]